MQKKCISQATDLIFKKVRCWSGIFKNDELTAKNCIYIISVLPAKVEHTNPI